MLKEVCCQQWQRYELPNRS